MFQKTGGEGRDARSDVRGKESISTLLAITMHSSTRHSVRDFGGMNPCSKEWRRWKRCTEVIDIIDIIDIRIEEVGYNFNFSSFHPTIRRF